MENVNVISRNSNNTRAMIIVKSEKYPKGQTLHLVFSKQDGWTDLHGRTYKL